MKTKKLFALFITVTVLLSGCGKPDTKLASENADLKARLQKVEQQLKASQSQTAAASQGSQSASIQDLQNQLDEAQKKAAADANELKSANSLVETQKVNIDDLMRELSNCQQATEKAGKALELYQDKAASAIKEFKALRSTLGDQTAKLDGYHQNFLATQTAVIKLLDALPESKVRRQLVTVLGMFTYIDNIWVTADWQMQARTQDAQAQYDKFVNFGGLGPNDIVIKMGKDAILAPAAQKNAVTASGRDQAIVSTEKDLDVGLKNLQDLVSGQSS